MLKPLTRNQKIIVAVVTVIVALLVVVLPTVFTQVLDNNIRPRNIPGFNFPTVSYTFQPPQALPGTAQAPNFIASKTFTLPAGYDPAGVMEVTDDAQFFVIASRYTDSNNVTYGAVTFWQQNFAGEYVNFRNENELDTNFSYPNRILISLTIENTYNVVVSFKSANTVSEYNGKVYLFNYDGLSSVTLLSTFTNPGEAAPSSPLFYNEFGRDMAATFNVKNQAIVYIAMGQFSNTVAEGSVQWYIQRETSKFELQPPISPGILTESYRSNWAYRIKVFNNHLLLTYPNFGKASFREDIGSVLMYTYEARTNTWNEVQKIVYPDSPSPSVNRFASTVATNANFTLMILGAPHDGYGDASLLTGTIFIYHRSPGDFGSTAWQLVSSTRIPNGDATLQLGTGVSMSDDGRFVYAGTSGVGEGVFVYRLKDPVFGNGNLIVNYNEGDPQQIYDSRVADLGYSGRILTSGSQALLFIMGTSGGPAVLYTFDNYLDA